MSKHWKPGRQSAALRPSKIRREPARPSRIRREPVRLESKADLEKAEARSRKLEIWDGVAGVVLTATAIAVLAVGIGVATIFYDRPATASHAPRFGQCYNSDGTNCVLDGDTFYVEGEKVRIAGIDTPKILGAACTDERDRGIGAAVRLADLLNSGKVTVSRPFRDDYGREVRTVKVDGEDVGDAMIDAGVAREFDGTKQDWCASRDAEQ